MRHTEPIRKLALPATALAVLVVACGSSGPDDAPVPTAVAPRPVHGIAPTERVTGRYSLDGRERRIRLAVTPTLITRKRRADYVVVPRGRAVVQVDLRLDDTGRDRLDVQVASFAAVDSAGSRVHEAFRLPVRELEPGAANSARVVSVGSCSVAGARSRAADAIDPGAAAGAAPVAARRATAQRPERRRYRCERMLEPRAHGRRPRRG